MPTSHPTSHFISYPISESVPSVPLQIFISITTTANTAPFESESQVMTRIKFFLSDILFTRFLGARACLVSSIFFLLKFRVILHKERMGTMPDQGLGAPYESAVTDHNALCLGADFDPRGHCLHNIYDLTRRKKLRTLFLSGSEVGIDWHSDFLRDNDLFFVFDNAHS